MEAEIKPRAETAVQPSLIRSSECKPKGVGREEKEKERESHEYFEIEISNSARDKLIRNMMSSPSRVEQHSKEAVA